MELVVLVDEGNEFQLLGVRGIGELDFSDEVIADDVVVVGLGSGARPIGAHACSGVQIGDNDAVIAAFRLLDVDVDVEGFDLVSVRVHEDIPGMDADEVVRVSNVCSELCDVQELFGVDVVLR